MGMVLVLTTVLLFFTTFGIAHPLDYSTRYSAPVTRRSVEASSTPGFSNDPSNSTYEPVGLGSLFAGNQRFRRTLSAKSAKRQVAEENVDAPSFMFFGCSDHRFSPSKIFDGPDGSFITHNTIANRYVPDDASTEASLAYAVGSEHVQHIIVLGHYGCKGVEAAIVMPDKLNSFLKSWILPIADLYRRTRRSEIVRLRDSRMPRRGLPNGIKDSPLADDTGFRALVQENVKQSVSALKQNSLILQSYQAGRSNPEAKAIFVHGFVHDETTGEVMNLNISFGPPGKPIPDIPFKALPQAQNFRSSNGPGVFKGKKWEFGHKP